MVALAPADAELHLALTELYLDRGWRAHAVDKLALLVRLVDLEGDRAHPACHSGDIAGEQRSDRHVVDTGHDAGASDVAGVAPNPSSPFSTVE